MYRAPLEAPLETLDLVFSTAQLPRGASAMVVDLLVVTLGLGLLVGHYGMYRVGMQHIALAAQRSDFVAAVSHELKTPLTSIRMYGEMLRAGWVTDETRRQAYYDFIFFESERLSRLIANVLQLARLTNQDAPLALQDYSLHQLLDVVRSKVSTQAEAAGFTIEWMRPSPSSQEVPLHVRAEEDAFTQILINLVDNAIKFSAKAELQRIDVGMRLTHRALPAGSVLCARLRPWRGTRADAADFSALLPWRKRTHPPHAGHRHRSGPGQRISRQNACQGRSPKPYSRC